MVTRRQGRDSGGQCVALGETLDLGGRRGSDIFLGKRQDICGAAFRGTGRLLYVLGNK